MKTKKFINILLVILTICFFAEVKNLYAQDLTKINKKNFKNAEKSIKNENYKGALNLYSTIIKDNPKHFLSRKGIADIYYEYYDTDKKNYDIAFENYTKAIKYLDIFLKTLKKGKKEYNEYLIYKTECETNLIDCERKLQSSKNQLVDNNTKEKEKETNTSKESTDEPFSNDFISPEFIEFTGNNKEEHIKQIQEVVGFEYDTLVIQGQINRFKTYKEIQAINKEWLKIKINKEYSWYNKLKELEGSYLQKLEGFNKTDYTIDRLDMELNIKTEEIKNLEEEIKNYCINRKMNIKFRDSLIVAELNSKLTTIPKSIVLIGRVLAPEGIEPKILTQTLLEKMCYWASQQKEGYFISKARVLNNGRYTAISEQTVAGKSQMGSKYYKNLVKHITIDTLIKSYKYQILRIEVYRSEIQRKSNNPNINNLHEQEKYTIDVFKVDKIKQESLINIKDSSISKMKEIKSHNFNDEEIDYIKFLTNFSKELNEKYIVQFDNAEKDYKTKYMKYEKIIKKIERKIDSLEIEKEKKEKSYTQKTNDLLKNKNLIIKIEQEYNNAQIEYENCYKNKLGYTNKLITEKTENIDETINLKDTYKQLVSKTFKAINELLDIDQRTTIYKEVNKEGTKKWYDVVRESYIPEVIGFKILSLSNYNESNYLSINIAYELNWINKPSLIIQQIPERLIQISETEDSIRWRIYKKGFTSYIDYMNDVEIQGETRPLRLPSINELENLFQTLAQEKRLAGKDKLIDMKWIDFIRHPLLSNSKVIRNNKEYYQCIKITDNYKYEYTIIEKEYGEFVSIILIEN